MDILANLKKLGEFLPGTAKSLKDELSSLRKKLKELSKEGEETKKHVAAQEFLRQGRIQDDQIHELMSKAELLAGCALKVSLTKLMRKNLY